jgi:tetratricopeptide (TPR) repeat protein
MVTHESRTYKLAKAAILAVLIAVVPATTVLRAQTTPKPAAAATKPPEDPLAALYNKAMAAMDKKQYAAALKDLEELEKKSTALPPFLQAVISFRKASVFYFQKDWTKADAELNSFLTKFPNGTEKFLDDNDNMRGVAQLTLVEVYANQSKWDDALKLLQILRTNPLIQPKDRLNAYTLSARIVEEKSKSGSEADKKQALGQAVGLLKQATAGGLNTPEAREAGMRLVEVYTKLGLVKDAEQLKAEIDAKGTGSPAEVVRSNFQRIEIGDARFEAGENAVEQKDKDELYRQALASYQGALRRASVSRSVTKAVELKQADLDKLVKENAKPTPEATLKIEAARAEVESFKTIQSDFEKNKDYDAFISYRIGLCLLELKRPWEAFVAFRDIFENNPGFSKVSGAYYYYILALREIGRNAEAQAKCKEFLSKYPDADEVSMVAVILGQISQDREEYEEAIGHYNWAKTNVKKMDAATLEEIDFRIICCLFAHVEWDKARIALDEFLAKHQRSFAKEQATYMRALCWFYQGKFKETKAGFDEYQAAYPKGEFIADVRYRQAIVKNGVNPPEFPEVLRLCNEWLRDYAVSKNEAVINQIPEVHTLIGDVEISLATALDKDIAAADKNVRTNAEPAAKAKYRAEKERLEKEKEGHTVKAIDAYVAAARSGRTNVNALEHVLRELGKLLPGRGEHARMRDLYKEIYDWNHADTKALNYLYEVIKATERMGDKPEFAQQAEAVQKKFSAQLAAARKKVDELVKTDGKPAEVKAAKDAVAKLSADLAAELDVVEKARQASILAAKGEALGILSGAVAESINDRKQEGSEKLILFLAEKLARKVKRLKPGATAAPDAYTAASAEEEITKLLRLEENKDSLIAQARGFFAKGQLAAFLRDPAKTDIYFKKISANYKAEELSPTILAIVGDHMLARGETKNSEGYFQYIMEHHRSSEYADFGFAGLAEIRLGQKKHKEALELCAEAIDNNVAMSKEKDLRFVKARALAETQKYDEAKKEFEEIAKTKEWKGETTAGCLYWLGVMEERQGRPAEAVGYYRRTYQAWKKYEVWSAKAYLGTARLFATKLDQKQAAKEVITEMLSKDRIKDTPEAAEARTLSAQL